MGDAIPLSGRIVAVADVYDALISERPYKRAWSRAEATRYVIASSGSHFEPRLVDAFLEIMVRIHPELAVELRDDLETRSAARIAAAAAAQSVEQADGSDDATRPMVRPMMRVEMVGLFAEAEDNPN
jgi:HD-GYP domain-containing protein (c-di-GMP phosphodiesterase class II)